MKRRAIAIICAICMVLSVTACGNVKATRGRVKSAESKTEKVKDEDTTKKVKDEETTVEKAEIEETTQESTVVEEVSTQDQTEENIQLGKHEGNVYENEFIGFGCKLDENWTCLSDEEILERNNFTVSVAGDEFKNAIQNANYIMDMLATHANQVDSVNVGIEQLQGIAMLADEKVLLQNSIPQTKAVLENMGIQNIEAEISTTEFVGAERVCMNVVGEINGVYLYEKLACVKKGRYLASVTAATWGDDKTDEILANFYSLQ